MILLQRPFLLLFIQKGKTFTFHKIQSSELENFHFLIKFRFIQNGKTFTFHKIPIYLKWKNFHFSSNWNLFRMVKLDGGARLSRVSSWWSWKKSSTQKSTSGIIMAMNMIRERCQKKGKEKKLTSVSFMYVCVAGNGEMLVFFSFFPPTIV